MTVSGTVDLASDWRHSRFVPKQFQLRAGIRAHAFRVLRASPHSYVQYIDSQGRPYEIDESASCEIVFRGSPRPLLLPFSVDARLAEGVTYLGAALSSGNRVNRYINLHNAYESIASIRRPEFSAIRHALAHPAGSLTKPATVAALTRMFGGPYINLHLHSHQAQFFRCLGQMLIETDTLLFEGILRGFPSWIRLRPSDRLHR